MEKIASLCLKCGFLWQRTRACTFYAIFTFSWKDKEERSNCFGERWNASHVNNYFFSLFCVKRIVSSVNDIYVCRTPVQKRLEEQASSSKLSPKNPFPMSSVSHMIMITLEEAVCHEMWFFFIPFVSLTCTLSSHWIHMLQHFLVNFHGNCSFYIFLYVHLS